MHQPSTTRPWARLSLVAWAVVTVIAVLLCLPGLARGAEPPAAKYYLNPDGTVERRLGDLESRVDAIEKKLKGGEPGKGEKGVCPCGPSGCKCAGDDDCGFPSCPAVRAGAEPAFAQPRSTTVYVSRELGGGACAAGTGTVIYAGGGKSLVLTNAHVVENGNTRIFVTPAHGDTRYEALYWHGSQVSQTGPGTIHVHGSDLCLLAVQGELPVAEIADELPAVGARVYQYGFGGRFPNQGPTEKQGQVVHPEGRHAGSGYPLLNTTIPSQSGDSGAGIFDENGRLVGVCWGAGKAGQSGVRLDEVHTFTVVALKETKGPFARLRDRLAARRLANAAAQEVAKQAARGLPTAVPSSPVQLPGPAQGGCPGGACPGGVCPPPSGSSLPYQMPGRFQGPVQSPFGGCPNGRCPSR